MIRKIQEECEVEIDIEDDGTVYIAAVDSLGAQKAIEMIESRKPRSPGVRRQGGPHRELWRLCRDPARRGRHGPHLLLVDYRVPSVEDGASATIMVSGHDIDEGGKIKLSRQAVLEG